jgi:dTDP-4-amino-4,6-dideoxygalactose transaminase
MVGTLGDLTAFSFYATKNLTTAEGGMLTGSTKPYWIKPDPGPCTG